MFSHTWRVCSAILPMPATDPSARRAVIPEMKTSRPFASTTVACEKTPLGFRMASDETSRLGMADHLRCVCVEWCGRDSELAGDPDQHLGNRCRELNLIAGIGAPAPFGLAGRKQGVCAKGAATGADMVCRLSRPRTEDADVAEMRDVDGKEKMRAVIRQREITVERLHLVAGRAARQEATY